MIQPIEHWRTLDDKGRMMPWYTRPCLEWLITLPLDKMSVFEYGCGDSTKWYDAIGAMTFGVDHSSKWLPMSCGHKLRSQSYDYTGLISYFCRDFDLVVIDGLYRDDCTWYALKHLAPGGYLIADNFEQLSCELPDWPKTRELTKHLPLTLYKEPTHQDWVTAVWHNA